MLRTCAGGGPGYGGDGMCVTAAIVTRDAGLVRAAVSHAAPVSLA